MRQCPDCEEKDRVAIAGKIFCANCGTPWQAANVAEEAEYKKKMGMGDSVATDSNEQPAPAPGAPADSQAPAVSSNSAPAAPSPSPSPSPSPAPSSSSSPSPQPATILPEPVASTPVAPVSPPASTVKSSAQPTSSGDQSSASPPVESPPSTPPVVPSTPAAAPPTTPQAPPTESSAPAPPLNAPAPAASISSTPPAPASQPTVSSPTGSTTAPVSVATAPTLPVTPPQPASIYPDPNATDQNASDIGSPGVILDPATSLSSSQVQSIATEMASANLKSEIGSEMHSLDSKEESVLSDAQIKEMSADAAKPELVPAPAPAPAAIQDTSLPAESIAMNSSPTLASQQPSVAQPIGSTTVVNDVVAPQTVARADTATLPSLPAPVPPQPTLPAGINTDQMTVAGVTMSRDDALKLALGEDAVTENEPKSKSPARPTAIVMTVIGLALMGMFLWQSNYPDISIKLASLRAGLTASVPSFVPSGWSKAQAVKAGEGSLSYELVKDGKALKIEQQKSDWDSQAVLEQHVLKRATDYLALQAQGLTIYMYEGNQAVWINQGTLYTISGDHGVDQDDIIRMATSL